MSSLIYLLRHSDDSFPRSLYTPADAGVTVIGIEETAGSSSLGAAVVLNPGSTDLARGQSLSYEKLLNVVLKGRKIITL